MSLAGKNAVATGAGSGIGRAIAVRLARDEAAIGQTISMNGGRYMGSA